MAKLKKALPCHSVILLLGIYPGETLVHMYAETCTKTAALFIMAKKKKRVTI